MLLPNGVKEDAANRATDAVEAVEQASTGGLFLSRVELTDQQHEGWSNERFAGTQEEATYSQTGKVVASRCKHQDAAPSDDEDRDYPASGKVLRKVRCRPLEEEVAEVEASKRTSAQSPNDRRRGQGIQLTWRPTKNTDSQ